MFMVLFVGAIQVEASGSDVPLLSPLASEQKQQLLAQRQMSLEKRYAVPSVNQVFKDNILLTIAYESGKVKDKSQIKWDEIRKSSTYEFTLQPDQVFAFHQDVLPEYQNKSVLASNIHFNAAEGFVSDGYLYGDGVCHYASLINWAARDAGLKVVAPLNHNFAIIPEIPAQYGTAIYSNPGDTGVNAQQNLYVENTFDQPVKFVVEYGEGGDLKVSVYKEEK